MFLNSQENWAYLYFLVLAFTNSSLLSHLGFYKQESTKVSIQVEILKYALHHRRVDILPTEPNRAQVTSLQVTPAITGAPFLLQ